MTSGSVVPIETTVAPIKSSDIWNLCAIPVAPSTKKSPPLIRRIRPKTRRKTLYCDRIIRDGKTCKQIAPAENHKKRSAANAVISVFEQSMNRMRRRLERSGEDKKESPIDIHDEQFCLWQNKAVNAKNRYLAGELTEEEAIELIYVPRKDELPENISAELTLETAAP